MFKFDLKLSTEINNNEPTSYSRTIRRSIIVKSVNNKRVLSYLYYLIMKTNHVLLSLLETF